MKELKSMFLESYNQHSDEIFRFAFFRLGDREKAKDLTQEVFMKMWLYLSNGNTVNNPRSFLYKTVSNLVIDEYRKRERTENKVESLDSLSDEGFDLGFDDIDSWINKIDGKKIIDKIKELPDFYTEVIFLRYVEEKTISEITKITGQTENAVSVSINRGLKKLKDLVEEKEKNI